MARGWIRAWAEEARKEASGDFRGAKDRSVFRKSFATPLRREAAAASDVLAALGWEDEVELADGIQAGPWTRVKAKGAEGFVASEHLVEIAYVKASSGRDGFTANLTREDGGTVKLLWGDPVQITKRSDQTCEVRARGMRGTIEAGRLMSDPLLELYFIDVGQGDGVLVRLPSGKHILIDGGLPRALQMTGKNAADFVDWKFHDDYGHYAISLDAMVASHCDYDHYGGCGTSCAWIPLRTTSSIALTSKSLSFATRVSRDGKIARVQIRPIGTVSDRTKTGGSFACSMIGPMRQPALSTGRIANWEVIGRNLLRTY